MNQWRKGIASWKVGDTLYQSIPFTWLLPEAEKQAREHRGKVVAGGTAVKLMGASWAKTPEETPFDVLAFSNPLATFTTRGCPNKCPFCAVPKIEGDLKVLDTWKPAPVVCDNNLLAAPFAHFKKVVDSLKRFPACDFNQGLDARLFSMKHAHELTRLKNPHIRFAFDQVNSETPVHDAVHLCRNKYSFKEVNVYCLIGYKDTPEDARYRLELVRSWGTKPNPMRYQPLDTLYKNSFVGENWTEKELRKMMKYYSRLVYLEHIPYDDFDYLKYDKHQEGFDF